MTLSDKSKNSNKILHYFEKKYCKSLAPIGLFKACAMVSALSKDTPRLNLCMVAPTRQFKSRTSIELKNIFTKNYYHDLGSDFTIHSFYNKFGNNLKHKCVMINDATLLLSSKSQRTKDRLINAFAEILSEGIYSYSDFNNDFDVKGEITMIMNITLESYSQNKNTLLSSTFLERFLTIFYSIPEEELDNFLINKRTKVDIIFDNKKLKKLKDYELKTDLRKYSKKITAYSKEFAILNYRSRIGMHDVVEALLKSHACLNERMEIIEDDFKFLEMLKPYLNDISAPNQHKILKAYVIGMKYSDICVLLEKKPSYKTYVSKVIKTARMRGVI